MRCLSCLSLSLAPICKRCQREYLTPQISRRKLDEDFEVISFYPYSEVKELITTKGTPIGYWILSILAKNSLTLFAKALELNAFVVPIDDRLKGGYSHTALLASKMKTKTLTPLYASLRARNSVKYAGTPLSFRKENPRGFVYKGREGEVILVDDILTTGTTLLEAQKAVRKRATPLFGVVLADARY